jgi:hypothetical protein
MLLDNEKVGKRETKIRVPKKKSKTVKTVKTHLRRIGLEVINLIFNHDFLFRLIGALNKRLHFIKSVFLVYPATRKYALAYVYPHRLPKVQWKPWLGGIHMQNGKIIVMFVISAHNGMFSNEKSSENLKRVARRMEKIKTLFGADQKTFAGVLPGLMSKIKVIEDPPEAFVTAQAVKQAIDTVLRANELDNKTPLVILGGNGFIGKRVIELIPKGQEHYSIDVENQDFWPMHLHGKRVVVINITVKSEIGHYIDRMWPGTIVLNEVYPEPKFDLIKKMNQKGVTCYHIVGIKPNFTFPSFPRAYQGAIPCCSAFISPAMEVVVSKMN